MKSAYLTLRTAFYAIGFTWFWAWMLQFLRPFDGALGGPLPVWTRAAGAVAMALGGAVVAWCMGTFVVQGRGTPALFDAPRQMVARGPYRYARNPMYIGGGSLLLGFGLFQRSPAIVLFLPVWWLLVHLLVVLYEEKTLHDKFGTGYDEYCRRTPRWLPRSLRPLSAGSLALLICFATLLHCADQMPHLTGVWTLDIERSGGTPLQWPDSRTGTMEHFAPAWRATSAQARYDRQSTGQRTYRAGATRGIDLRVQTRVAWGGMFLAFNCRSTYGAMDGWLDFTARL